MQQRSCVDNREVVGTGEIQCLLIGLIGRKERENRELVGIREQTKSTVVVVVSGRHQSFGVRIVIVEFLIFGERSVADPLVQQQLAVGVPEVVEHILLDAVGDFLHLLRFAGISRGRVCLGCGIGVRPHVGRTVRTIHTLSGTSGLGE